MITEAKPVAPLPTELRSPRAKLVYLYLSTQNGATISELQNGLQMKKISLYSILKTLQKRGVVAKNADQYVPSAQ